MVIWLASTVNQYCFCQTTLLGHRWTLDIYYIWMCVGYFCVTACLVLEVLIQQQVRFNGTYYTVAHKCNKQQLLAAPASYENKRLGEKCPFLWSHWPLNTFVLCLQFVMWNQIFFLLVSFCVVWFGLKKNKKQCIGFFAWRTDALKHFE